MERSPTRQPPLSTANVGLDAVTPADASYTSKTSGSSTAALFPPPTSLLSTPAPSIHTLHALITHYTPADFSLLPRSSHLPGPPRPSTHVHALLACPTPPLSCGSPTPSANTSPSQLSTPCWITPPSQPSSPWAFLALISTALHGSAALPLRGPRLQHQRGQNILTD